MATSRGQRVILADFTALTSSARVSWFLLRLGLIHSRGRFVYVAINFMIIVDRERSENVIYVGP